MKMPEINQRIKQLIDFSTNGVVKKFAESVGLPQQTLNRLFVIDRRVGKYPLATTEVLQKILEKYDINACWLLSGEGEMLRNPTAQNQCESAQGIPLKMAPAKNNDGIPLIPVSAMAGFGSGDMQVLEHECERFVIPVFKEAEFLISIKGSSMYPKYSSGDMVACRKLPLDTFFQWHKVYVLDTEQGALIKRIEEGETPDTLTIVSDNQEYKPFQLHKSKIYLIAIVLGVIRQES
jgi:phage repressor protein C with HTH and peptisase S24 domain